MIRDPAAHTLHCIRDIEVCVASGYVIAVNIGDAVKPDYQVRFRLDAAGNQNALQLINASPLVAGMMVTATGEDAGDGVLRDATMVPCTAGLAACDGVCVGCDPQVAYTHRQGPVPYDLVIAHGGMLLLAWLWLAPMAALIKRHAATVPFLAPFLTAKVGGKYPVAFLLHGGLMLLAVLLTCIAVGIALGRFDSRAQYGHGTIGVIVLLLALWQPLPALLCRPDHGSPRRSLFNRVHRTGAGALLLLAVVNVFLGIRNFDLLWDQCTVPVFVGFAGAGLGLWLLVSLGLEWKMRSNPHVPPAGPKHITAPHRKTSVI